MRAIAVGDARRALEGDAVVLRRAEAVEIVEIGDLIGRESEDRIGVHRDEIVAVRAGALDAGAGDVMRVGGQAFSSNSSARLLTMSW